MLLAKGSVLKGANRVPMYTCCKVKVHKASANPSGSGQVDMLAGPVAAARAVVATGAWVKSKHDM